MKRAFLFAFLIGFLSAPMVSFAQYETSYAAESYDESDGEYAQELEEVGYHTHEDEWENYTFQEFLWNHMPLQFYSGKKGSCYRISCRVWADIDKTTQTMYLYVDGSLYATWPVSTGLSLDTPNMDTHPNGRIYTAYTSKKHPGGDYKGLGNMPYAVFIRGGIAIHGTPQSNWKRLGKPASHGCIRLHPDNALIFRDLVKSVGIYQTWVTIRGVRPKIK